MAFDALHVIKLLAVVGPRYVETPKVDLVFRIDKAEFGCAFGHAFFPGYAGGMPLRPVDPRHRKNVRDDDYRDFHALKSSGQVRNKLGIVIGIDDPHTAFSARQRDELYQSYCEFAIQGRTDKQLREWIVMHAKKAGMSVSRATRIIAQGNGEWPSPNAQWWRGVSL